MTKRKGLLIALIVAFCLSLAMFIISAIPTQKAQAATYELNVVNESLEQNYFAHWKKGQNSAGAKGGTWAIGYGDVSSTGATGGDVYSFTAMSFGTAGDDTARYSTGTAHQFAYTFDLTTRLYSTASTQTLMAWTSKGNGHVSFNGMFAKTSDMETKAATLNGLSGKIWLPGVNWGASNFAFRNGDSYTISINVVKPLGQGGTGNPSVVTIASQTYTSEYAYLIPQNEIWVEAGDIVVFGLKCNALASGMSEWGTNTVALIDATFTAKELPGTYKQLYSVTGGTAWSSYDQYFSKSIVAGEGPFNWVEKSNFLTGHTNTIYMKLPVTTWKDSFSSYALWVELPATSADLVFTPKYYDGSVGQTRTLTKGTMIHTFDEGGAYSAKYISDTKVNMGKTGFKGWIVFPIEFARANIVDPGDDFIFEFASGHASVNNIKFGGFGVYYDMAEFLYAYAPNAADTYYSGLIDDYVTKTNALTASSTFQTNKKAEIVSWLNGLKGGMSSQTTAQKLAWAKTLNEDYVNEYAEYQAQFILEGNPKNSVFVLSDTHMTASADGKTLMTSALRDMTAFQKAQNVNAIAVANLGDLSQWGLDYDNPDANHNDLDDYYDWILSEPTNTSYHTYLKDLSGNKLPYLNVLGNHDVRGNINDILPGQQPSEADFKNYEVAANYYMATDEILKASTSKSTNGMNFSYEINGYTFIMLNTAEYQWDNCMLSENDLVWLENELAKVEEGKPCFILVHQPVDLIYSKIDGSSVSGKAFQDIINKFSNVVVLSGHAHHSFGKDGLITYADSGSVYVNMPSLYYNYYTPYNTKYGEGICQYYYMEIYENGIVLKGRDFGFDQFIPESTVAFARTSTVEFQDYDGNSIDKKSYEWGATPVAPANPTRPATATTTYTFNGWDSTISVVKGAKTYVATYTETPITYAVTVTNDDNKGTISGVASQSYNAGTVLNINITPKTGYEIKSVTWNGSAETVTATGMTLNKTITDISSLVVEYEATANTYSLTINNNNSQGIITGVTAGEYVEGTPFNISITAETGYKIVSVSWGSDSVVVSNELGFSFNKNLTANTQLTVTYAKIEYAVTITAPDATISGGNTYQVAHGENLIITVTPTTNYQITSILINGVESISTALSGNTVTIQNVTQTTSVEITCELPSYTVTVNVTNGTVNGMNSLQIVHGQNSSFNITPNVGYEFSYAEVNGVRNDTIFSAGSSYDVVALNGITQETVINVYYVIKTYSVSIQATGATVSGNTTLTVNHGESATFNITPTSGYELHSLTINGNDSLASYSSGVVSIASVTEATNVVIVFTDPVAPPTEYTVSITATGATVNGNTTISVVEGNSAVFNITPNANYELSSLLVNGSENLSAYSNGVVTISNVTENTEIVVVFTEIIVAPSTFTVEVQVVGGIVNGNSSVEVVSGENAVFSITPNTAYTLSTLTINGVANLNAYSNGTLTIANVTEDTTVVITFTTTSTEVVKYTVKATFDKTQGSVSNIVAKVNAGTKISPKITAKTGYVIKSITINGKEQTITNDISMTIKDYEVNANTTIVVEFEAVEDDGCGSNVNGILPVGIATILGAVALMVVKKLKKD